MVGWAITDYCNLSCIYCSQNSGKFNSDELSTEEALKTIDQIAQYQASVIGWTGGEPFSRPDFDTLVNYSYKKGLRNVVTTNGTLIRNLPIKLLLKFVKIRISLDSTNSKVHDKLRGQEGAHLAAIEAIQIVRNLGIKVEVVSTIGQHNVHELKTILSLLESLRVPEWSVSILMPTGRASTHYKNCFTPSKFKSIVKNLHKLKSKAKLNLKTDIPQDVLFKQRKEIFDRTQYCAAGTNLLVIFADGSIGPCFTTPLTDGNVRKNNLYKIWNESHLFNLFRDKELLEGNCKNCDLKYPCGGCRAHALAATGNILMGDPLCWYHKLKQEKIEFCRQSAKKPTLRQSWNKYQHNHNIE